MTPGGAVGIGAVAAALMAGWNNIRDWLLKTSGYFMHRVSFDDLAMIKMMQLVMKEGWKPFPNKHRHIHAIYKYVKSRQELSLVLHENICSRNERVMFRKGLALLSVDVNNTSIMAPKYVDMDDMIRRANSLYEFDRGRGCFYAVRVDGTRFQTERFSEPKAASPGAPSNGRPNLFIEREDMCWPIGIDKAELVDNPHRTINNLWLSAGMKEASREARTWFEKRKWFLDRNIPWRRGFIFHGRPGTGKSKLALAIAQDLEIPMHIFDLSSMTNKDFVKLYDDYSGGSAGRIVLLEDIDAVFDGRENRTATQQSPGLTFDCLLNVLDGVETNNGTLLIITTNDLSKLDEALIRPGRVDRRLELNGLDREGRAWMAGKIFKGFEPAAWQDLVEAHDDHVTGATFQEACCRRAMELFWKDEANG